MKTFVTIFANLSEGDLQKISGDLLKGDLTVSYYVTQTITSFSQDALVLDKTIVGHCDEGTGTVYKRLRRTRPTSQAYAGLS